jgi:hypothetical protein
MYEASLCRFAERTTQALFAASMFPYTELGVDAKMRPSPSCAGARPGDLRNLRHCLQPCDRLVAPEFTVSTMTTLRLARPTRCQSGWPGARHVERQGSELHFVEVGWRQGALPQEAGIYPGRTTPGYGFDPATWALDRSGWTDCKFALATTVKACTDIPATWWSAAM